MKLLILTNNPRRASFRLRIQAHLELLRQNGFECAVFQMPRSMAERWDLLKQCQNYDAVLVQRKRFNWLDAKIIRHYAKRLIFDFDDALMFSPARPTSRWTSHWRLFFRTARLMDLIIAGNDYLADLAKRVCKNVAVLPTGLDTRPYQNVSRRLFDGKTRLVWIGSRSTLPYLESIKSALETLGQKYPNVLLRIIADEFFDPSGIAVEKCRWDQATEIQDLKDCDIGLSPLSDNPYTRGKCGFKILQYLAAGLPVVASPVGVNQKFMQESQAGFIAQSLTEWVSAIEKLLVDPALCQKLGRLGPPYAAGFDQQIIGAELCRILKAAMRS